MASITVLFLVLLPVKFSCQANLVYESENLENDGKTVLLGGLFPIHATDSNGTVPCGELLEDSVQRVEAMVLTINRVNENSELLPKIKLAFSIRDTCSNPSYGLEQAFQYVQSKSTNFICGTSNKSYVSVSGVVGAQFSRVSINIANLLRLYQIPQISYSSTADTLGDKTRFDYFFRTIPPDALQARAIADIIVLFKWTYIFMLYSDDAYGSGGIEALIDHLSLHNKSTICTAAKIPLSVTATSQQYDAAIATMSQDYVRNATVAVLFGHIEAAVGMMQALERAQMQGDYALSKLTWLGTDSWGDSLPSKFHNIVGGILSVLPRANRDPNFDSYFTSLRPDNYPPNVWFNELWELMFGCSLSNVMCREQGKDRTLNTTEYHQASQITLVSDAVLAFAHAIHKLVESRCPNSTLCDTIMEDRLLGKAINGNLLRQYLYKISFQGPSSNVISFDPDGVEVGAFFIKNLQRSSILDDTFTFETVGTWNYESSLDFTSDIQWVTGDIPRSICSNPCEGGKHPIRTTESQCCWSCSPCQSEKGFSDGISSCQDCNESTMPNSKKSGCIPMPVSYLNFSNVWSIMLLAFTVLGLSSTAFIIILFLVFFKHDVTKATSRDLSTILLVGLVLCYTMPFFFVGKPSPAVCAIRRFGVGFSFAVCFSALLIKTNRIYRIFIQNSLDPSKPPRFISPLSQVIVVLVVIGIQVLHAIIWLAVIHPSTAISYGRVSAVLKCGYSPIIYLVASLGYNLVLLILSTYFAFRARNALENSNETKYINTTLYTLCIMWIAFISTYFLTFKLGAIFQAISLMTGIILSTTTTLICIFVPKVILLFTNVKGKQQIGANNPIIGLIPKIMSASLSSQNSHKCNKHI